MREHWAAQNEAEVAQTYFQQVSHTIIPHWGNKKWTETVSCTQRRHAYKGHTDREWISCGNHTWHASKCKVYKLHLKARHHPYSDKKISNASYTAVYKISAVRPLQQEPHRVDEQSINCNVYSSVQNVRSLLQEPNLVNVRHLCCLFFGQNPEYFVLGLTHSVRL